MQQSPSLLPTQSTVLNMMIHAVNRFGWQRRQASDWTYSLDHRALDRG